MSYLLDSLWREYICAIQGHIVSWNAGGTSASYLPDEAPCNRCGLIVKLT